MILDRYKQEQIDALNASKLDEKTPSKKKGHKHSRVHHEGSFSRACGGPAQSGGNPNYFSAVIQNNKGV